MLRFQHLYHLFALGIIPLLIILFIWALVWRRKKIQTIGDSLLISGQLKGYIAGRNTLKFVLLSITVFMLVIGWANLQSADKTEKVQQKGIDVIFALDVSKSMLATDMQPDRLTRAKQFIMHMVDKMDNDRVGLIVFAGRAYMQVPLTVDYNAVKMMLQNVSPDMIPTQGTVIGQAIDMATESFSKQEKKYKSFIIISDGEDHDEHAVEKAKDATETGIITHTIGIGSAQGANLYDPSTRSIKLDENGNPVVSRLNEDALKAIATAGHGTYNLLQNTDQVAEKLLKELDGMEQKSLGGVIFTDYTSYFQYFLTLAFIMITIEWLLPGSNRKIKMA